MAKCKNCKKYDTKARWCETIDDSPDDEMERDCDRYERMTNADRIRGMNDYEMAELFDRMIGAGEARSALTCEDYCPGCAFVCKKDRMCEKYDGKESYDAVMEWLQSEVEE